MNTFRYTAPLLVTLTVAACGGSSDGGTPNNVTSYKFVVPQVNATRNYNEIITDDSANIIDLSYVQTVTSNNPDGGYTVFEHDPSNKSLVVKGYTYNVSPRTITLTSSDQALVNLNYATQSTCADYPFGPGPTFPVVVGTKWNNPYTENCDSAAPINYSQSGAAVGLETIIVPAGTFATLRLENTVIGTDMFGGVQTETMTIWRDAASGAIVRQHVNLPYHVEPPGVGQPVSIDIELTGMSH